jgi:Ca2+-dependent lipid-binding protein
MGVLTVFLDNATNLADTDCIGKTDPYVRFDLKQDNWGPFDRDFGYQKSSVKPNTMNPVYHETFVWHNVPELKNLVLNVRIMDDDFGTRDDKVGSCTIQLDKLGLSQRPINVDKIVDRNIFTKNGMIHLKVSFVP